jgi:GDPmannose 4,6-dehydratase
LKKSVVIFGSNSQDGFYLNELLIKEQFEVVNISRTSGDFIGSVGEYDFVENIIKVLKPDYIFHFAASSTTHHDVTLENNNSISTGAINILESVKRHSLSTKVFISGSALQFKNNGVPIDEETPFDYSTSYAISRTYSVNIARYYREKFGVKAYVGYFFNHDSPFRSEKHINQKIVSHVIRVDRGSRDKLIIGNLNVRKEFSFAKDIVDAVWLLVNQDNLYETVIGSGIAYSIKEWVSYCFEKYSLDWKDYVIIDEKYKTEYEILVSNPQQIKLLGWKPQTSIFELADIMLQSEFEKNNK